MADIHNNELAYILCDKTQEYLHTLNTNKSFDISRTV